MKIIFTQDVPGIGQKHEVKKMKAGYVRNYLIPKKLAKLATPTNLNWLKAQGKTLTEKKKKGAIEAQNLATLIAKKNFEIKTRVGEKGQLFESINKEKIVSLLTEQNFKIKKSQLQLENPIKELGKYEIKIDLNSSTTAVLHLQVSAIN